MSRLADLFVQKPYLSWYVEYPQTISVESMLEHILNYGEWEDYLLVENELGIKKTKRLFDQLKNKPRPNLRKTTINYFDQYFQKYA